MNSSVDGTRTYPRGNKDCRAPHPLMLLREDFCNIHDSSPILSACSQTLYRPEYGKKRRGRRSRHLISRQATHGSRGDSHGEDAGDESGLLRAYIGHVTKDYSTQRSGDEADCEHTPERQRLGGQEAWG